MANKKIKKSMVEYPEEEKLYKNVGIKAKMYGETS